MRLRALCFIAVCSSAALAQVEEHPVSEGVEQPAQAGALQEGPTALSQSPGGLAFGSGFELSLARSSAYKSGTGSGTGLFAGVSGPLAAAASVEWLQRGASCTFLAPCPRRTSFGLGLRLGALGVGAAFHSFSSSEVRELDGLTTWDLGATLRPLRWLSLSAAVLDWNRPLYGNDTLPRRWQLSLGFKPVGEIAQVAADLRFKECHDRPVAPELCGADHGDFVFTLDAQLVKGVRVIGQLGLPNLGDGLITGQLGLQLDLGHLGLRYAARATEDSPARSAWLLRLSSEQWPGVELPVGRVALIQLDKALEKPKAGLDSLLFGRGAHDPLQQTLAAFHRLAQDPRVRAVVLRSAELPIGYGKAEELRAGIEGMQQAGKKVIFYLESGGDLEYDVASQSDRVYAAPQAVLTVNGFAATALFAAAGLDKLGVKAEFFRVGAYKNAPDTFTRSGMSGEQREVQNSLLDDVYARYVRRVAEKRHLEEAKVRALLDKGMLQPREAQDAGLLDGLLYPDQLEEEVGKLLGGAKVPLEKTSVQPEPLRDTRWTGLPRVVVIRVEGDIFRGEGQKSPLGAVELAGSDAIARRIRKAADDPGVAAIVVRIDSPGGDGNASDLIWRELVRARKEKNKPVIASMGDVAASGGYYVAAGADEIWAQPGTITGSIGVFVGHFDAEELLGKLGLNLVTIKRGASADILSPHRDLTDEERKTLQAWVDNFYDQFLDRVSEARKLDKKAVDAVARGRVWTGAQALERKLVDHLGGLEDALASARKKAGLSADDEIELDDEVAASFDLGDVASAQLSSALPLPGKQLAGRAARALQLLGEPGTLRAALPFDLELR